MNDDKIQDLVNKLSQDISRDAHFRDKIRKLIIYTIVIASSVLLLGFFAYLVYLNYTIHKIQEELAHKQNMIDDLEASLNSLMYAEQLREETSLNITDIDDYDQDYNIKLEKKVLNNLKILEKASEGYKGNNILRGNTKFPEIALTFDLSTGQELSYIENLIKKYDIHVTIFLSNERPSDSAGSFFLRSNIESIQRLAKTGKVEFGNHTWSHYNYVRSIHETSYKKRKALEYISQDVLTLEAMAEELNKVEIAFKNLTGLELKKYYRLPYGAINSLILNVHSYLGYGNHIMWSKNSVGSLDIPDYIHKQFITIKDTNTGKIITKKNPLYKSSREALEFLYDWERADAHGMNGAIILMHLGSPRKFDRLILILPEFIETMKSKGYYFRKVSEVLNDELDR